jgi:hypothetical protein
VSGASKFQLSHLTALCRGALLTNQYVQYTQNLGKCKLVFFSVNEILYLTLFNGGRGVCLAQNKDDLTYHMTHGLSCG